MSYRGLITLKSLDEPNGSPRDLYVNLGDDFAAGDELVAQARTYATMGMALTALKPMCRAILEFASPDDRDQWVRDWADKVWTITWHGHRAEVEEQKRE